MNQAFFEKDSVALAQDLLGCTLVHVTLDGLTSGIIVETEAYNQDDAASHSYKGQTERTRAMFGPSGRAYIYFTYGMHYCFNVVSGPVGRGEGVLIRALKPVEGFELMRERRKHVSDSLLCNGPAKLVQALGITKADYGKKLFDNSELYIIQRQNTPNIQSGPRIGITKAIDEPFRFWVKDSPHISKIT